MPGGRNLNGASSLGARVRALRHERGLTLKALGRAADLSHPFLSQLERGLARPSVGSVERIAHALGVPVGHLWAAPRTAAERLRGHEWTGGGDWPPEPATCEGPVLVYVAHGELELELDGRVHALGEADTLVFDGSRPHRLRGPAKTRALYVATGT